MGYDIQINPTAEASGIGFELFQLIDRWATDFEMKYCYIERGAALLDALRAHAPRDEGERRVVLQLIEKLESDDGVELLIGY